MKTKILHLTTLLILLFSIFAPTYTAHAFATTWYVESTADGAANAAHCPGAACTLRDAVAKASPGDIIRFNLPAYPADIILTNGHILINKNLTIQGPGSSDLTVSGNLASRIFRIAQYNVTISGLTLLDGRAQDEYGGAIDSRGNLTLDDMLITQNATTAVTATYLRGGGISQNGGSLTITNSQITENYAAYAGGACPSKMPPYP
ncbi:MAG: hypothetical protein IPJ46_08915 [Anaerolineales bacterium]|nr:hypothetical protein [Anaerolineales bacterium]